MTTGATGIEVTHARERIGPYELVDRIGAGGMAEGWRAVKHIGATKQKVFFKRILREHRSDPDYVEWFRREAAIVASLRHANIVLLLDADPYGRYLVFELIAGLDLRHLLRSQPNHRLPVNMSVLILAEVLKALSHAHGRTSGGAPAGVIHRDLDPSNVLISYEGEVKVADFGVAAVMRCDGEAHTNVVGKEPYQAPEETRNEPGLDGRCDLFSLGVMAYQMLSGVLPYTGTKAQIARAIAAGRRRPLQEVAPPEVPVALAELVERLLSPNPADRFASAPEFEHALHGVCAPNPMLYRQLGHMALRARPHETMEPALHRGSHEPHPVEESPTHVRRATDEVQTVPNAEELPASASGSELLEPPEPAAPPTGRAAEVVEDGATAARRARRRARGYVALGLALTAAGLVTVVRMKDIASSHQPPPAAKATAATSPPPQPPPAAPAAPPARTTIAPQTIVATGAETPAPTPEPTPVATGTLRIGAVPQSQVWVDGRLVGWSPIRDLRVPAGQHTVSIGRDGREDATTRRPVTVTPGHQQRVGF